MGDYASGWRPPMLFLALLFGCELPSLLEEAAVDTWSLCSVATSVAVRDDEVIVGCMEGMSAGPVGLDQDWVEWDGWVKALVPYTEGAELAVVGKRDGFAVVEDYATREPLLALEEGQEGAAEAFAESRVGNQAVLLDSGRVLFRAAGGATWRALGQDELPEDPDRYLVTHAGLLMVGFSDGQTLTVVPLGSLSDRRDLEQDTEVSLTALHGMDDVLVALGVDRTTGEPRITSFPDGLWEEPVVDATMGSQVTLAAACGTASHLLVVGEDTRSRVGVAWESTNRGRSWEKLELYAGPLVACYADEASWVVVDELGEVQGTVEDASGLDGYY